MTSWRFVSLLLSRKTCNVLMCETSYLWSSSFNVHFLKSKFLCIPIYRQNIRKLFLPTSGTEGWSSHQVKLLSCTIQR